MQIIQRDRILFILIVIPLLIVLTIGIHDYFTEPFPGQNDFLPRWDGARLFFEDGLSPYSDETSLAIQMRIFGRAAEEGEDPALFVYPFHIIFVMFPITLLEYSWAAAVWLTILLVCLVVSLFMLLDIFQWKPPIWLLAILIFWSIGDYYPSRGVILGQPSLFVYFCQILAFWGLYKRHDGLSGFALALSTVKPHMGYLIIPFILLWAIRNHRRNVVYTFTVTMSVFLGASFLLEPSWLTTWIDQVRLYPEYTALAYPGTGSPLWIVIRNYLALPAFVEWFFGIMFYGLLIYVWYQVLIKQHNERFLWAVMLTFIVTNTATLRSATPHFVIFGIVALFYFKYISNKSSNILATGLIISLFVFNWTHFIIGLQGRGIYENPSMFIPIPFAALAILVLDRKRWWALSPAILPTDSGNNSEPLKVVS